MKAKIREKNKVALDTLEVKFQVLDDDVNFKPGQFFFVKLPNALVHHFTIANSPNEKNTLSFTTRMRDSAFKNSIKEMEIGSDVEVDRIMGGFTLPEDLSQPLVFIALGIGITPFVSMTRYIKENHRDVDLTLIYSDSNKESMAYLNEFERLAEENKNFRSITTITKDENWKGEKRRVGGEMLKDYITDLQIPKYYISGPPQAVEAVQKSLLEAGIGESKIKTEGFSGY